MARTMQKRSRFIAVAVSFLGSVVEQSKAEVYGYRVFAAEATRSLSMDHGGHHQFILVGTRRKEGATCGPSLSTRSFSVT